MLAALAAPIAAALPAALPDLPPSGPVGPPHIGGTRADWRRCPDIHTPSTASTLAAGGPFLSLRTGSIDADAKHWKHHKSTSISLGHR